jgi:hypothetical protein
MRRYRGTDRHQGKGSDEATDVSYRSAMSNELVADAAKEGTCRSPTVQHTAVRALWRSRRRGTALARADPHTTTLPAVGSFGISALPARRRALTAETAL